MTSTGFTCSDRGPRTRLSSARPTSAPRDRGDDDRDEQCGTVEHVLDVDVRALLLQSGDPDADDVDRDHGSGDVVPPRTDARRPEERSGERRQERPETD